MSRVMRYLDVLLIAIIALSIYAGAVTFGPLIERRFFPVVTPFEITKVEPAENGKSRIWIEFYKRRECLPIGVYLYRGRRGGPFDQVNYVIEQRRSTAPFVNRPLGQQSAGPWLLDMPPTDLESWLFADAQHRCNAFWITVTHFYR